jgi:agmatinase
MSKKSFDPNSTATGDAGIFGLQVAEKESLLHLVPVPWEVTTSYGDGASRGPAAILRASHQVDLFDIETGDVYQNGYFMLPISNEVAGWNREFKGKAKRVLESIEDGTFDEDGEAQKLQGEINQASERLNQWVYKRSRQILDDSRFAAVIGGDHSTPFGLIQAIAEKYQSDFGILHIDAHADLRENYQGYGNSHASIMYNVMTKLKPKALVQVGIRDFSQGEFDFIEDNPAISTYFDVVLKRRQHRGETWQKICDEMVAKLPQQVYISFDIDGLSPSLCPNTGTPVPGGLEFEEVLTLFATVVESGRRMVGFDLNEVAEPEIPVSDWDGNVGARILFKLCGWLMVSNGFNPSRGRDA